MFFNIRMDIGIPHIDTPFVSMLNHVDKALRHFVTNFSFAQKSAPLSVCDSGADLSHGESLELQRGNYAC